MFFYIIITKRIEKKKGEEEIINVGENWGGTGREDRKGSLFKERNSPGWCGSVD